MVFDINSNFSFSLGGDLVKPAPWLGNGGASDINKSGSPANTAATAAAGGIWKSPPGIPGGSNGSNRIKPDAARLSPDSGMIEMVL